MSPTNDLYLLIPFAALILIALYFIFRIFKTRFLFGINRIIGKSNYSFSEFINLFEATQIKLANQEVEISRLNQKIARLRSEINSKLEHNWEEYIRSRDLNNQEITQKIHKWQASDIALQKKLDNLEKKVEVYILT